MNKKNKYYKLHLSIRIWSIGLIFNCLLVIYNHFVMKNLYVTYIHDFWTSFLFVLISIKILIIILLFIFSWIMIFKYVIIMYLELIKIVLTYNKEDTKEKKNKEFLKTWKSGYYTTIKYDGKKVRKWVEGKYKEVEE